MKPGNKTVSIFCLSLLGLFAAADAGRVGEGGTGAVWVAPELLEALAATQSGTGAAGSIIAEAADLRLGGRVSFEFHPATGELSFTLPEEFLPGVL